MFRLKYLFAELQRFVVQHDTKSTDSMVALTSGLQQRDLNVAFLTIVFLPKRVSVTFYCANNLFIDKYKFKKQNKFLPDMQIQDQWLYFL